MQSFGLALAGRKSAMQWRVFLRELARNIGMHPSHAPAIWHYPVNGKGGTGVTVVQPITDSFIALDSWDDHNGAYLLIVSCKPFDTERVKRFCVLSGLSPDSFLSGTLSLP